MNCGCIQPICDFLTVIDSDIIQVALNALENILKAGEKFASRENPYAVIIEECGGKFSIYNIIIFISMESENVNNIWYYKL